MPVRSPDWSRERHALARGFRRIAGIDEAGRGALAGPVVAAAVILSFDECPCGVRDSKTLSAAARERLVPEVISSARAWGVGKADASEIDEAGIVEATRRAMIRAVRTLAVLPDYLIVDAVRLDELGIPFEAPVKADRDVMSVAAASILAKVARDRMLRLLGEDVSGYGFGAHKGYGTREHFRALAVLGPSSAHRRTFEPVASLLAEPTLLDAGSGSGRCSLPGRRSVALIR